MDDESCDDGVHINEDTMMHSCDASVEKGLQSETTKSTITAHTSGSQNMNEKFFSYPYKRSRVDTNCSEELVSVN